MPGYSIVQSFIGDKLHTSDCVGTWYSEYQLLLTTRVVLLGNGIYDWYDNALHAECRAVSRAISVEEILLLL